MTHVFFDQKPWKRSPIRMFEWRIDQKSRVIHVYPCHIRGTTKIYINIHQIHPVHVHPYEILWNSCSKTAQVFSSTIGSLPHLRGSKTASCRPHVLCFVACCQIITTMVTMVSLPKFSPPNNPFIYPPYPFITYYPCLLVTSKICPWRFYVYIYIYIHTK